VKSLWLILVLALVPSLRGQQQNTPHAGYVYPAGGRQGPAVRVRVSDANTGSPADVSNAPFAIVVPALTASPEALAFGQVDIGSTRTDTLIVTNVGSTTVVVSSVTVAGGGPFTPNTWTYTVANTGDAAINWSAVKTQDWLTLSKVSGTLAAGQATSLTVTVTASERDSPLSGAQATTL
jgi:hypothetical protein